MSYIDTLNQYITNKNGSLVEGDTAANRGECVGLVEEFYDLFNLPHIWGNACDMPANADRNAFDIVPNSASYVPPMGAAAVFPAGWGGSKVGHVGLVAPGTTATSLVLFEANDRIGGGNGSARLHTFDYSANPTFIVPKIFNQPNQGENIVKPTEQEVYQVFRQFLGHDPVSPDEVNYYLNNDKRELYYQILYNGIQPKLSEIQQAFKDLQPDLPIDSPPFTDQSTYYQNHPSGFLYKDLGYHLISLYSKLKNQPAPPKPDPVPTPTVDPNSITITKDGLWARIKSLLGLS